ncbi:MAG TPA: hypothetical protein VNE40_00250 [Candidatus Dormibacteraeota bacterium]|nr:hypothetical protein [Candidatus Dormibacteraeota bacterium]
MSTIQYTIRGVPSEVDSKLRRLANLRSQSLNQVVLEQLSSNKVNSPQKSTDITKSKVNTDFDDLFGTITPLEPEVEAALSSQRAVRPKDWQ